MQLRFFWNGEEAVISRDDIIEFKSQDPVQMADFLADIITISEVLYKKITEIQEVSNHGKH
jgi:hypothetical protein